MSKLPTNFEHFRFDAQELKEWLKNIQTISAVGSINKTKTGADIRYAFYPLTDAGDIDFTKKGFYFSTRAYYSPSILDKIKKWFNS